MASYQGLNLGAATVPILHSAPVSAGTSDVDSLTGVDTADCEAVLFEIWFGTITGSAVTSVKLQQSEESAANFSDLEGTAITVPDTASDKVFRLVVVRPRERYVRVFVDRGTQNAEIDLITAHKFGLKTLPYANDDTVVGGYEVHVSPAEGTA